MAMTFNADEIFEMAEEIERQGAAFYRKAAKHAPDDATRKMFLNMAAMEDNHEVTFAAMRRELSAAEKENDTFDPRGEAALYLQAMADSHGTEGKKSPSDMLTGNESIEEVLEAAVRAEADSVAFYTGIKEMVPAKAGRDKIETIIREEIGHLADLKGKLVRLRS
ncbi:MAG: ferritin family protein [Sedimentisphaerales bacterium]|nr:ferritin family protein [Sedimentisphaerales bacterium]